MKKSLSFFITFMLIAVTAGATGSLLPYKFDKFDYNDKLPSNSVIRIFNDKEGFMWFGTRDGLCRFDGYSVKVFRSSALTPGKLTNNEIQCIAEDNYGKLWVGTIEGINIFDKKNFFISPLVNKYISKERINSILCDSHGYIWIATSNYGVLRMNPNTYQFERFSTDKNSPLQLKSNNVTYIYEDHNGTIWLSLWKGGLCYIDKSLKHIDFAPKIGRYDNPFRVFQDKSGLYWICTWGDGIFNMTVNSDHTPNIHPLIVSKNSKKHVNDIVYSITQDDKFGYIWVVTFSDLSIIQKEPDGTFNIVSTENLFNQSDSRLFHEISKDRLGNLWVGSVGEGLYKLDFNKPAIQNFPLDEIKNKFNAQSYVTKFCELNSGNIYININRIGLFQFNIKNGEVVRPRDPVIRSLSSISAIVNQSKTNLLWLANEGENNIHIYSEDQSGNLNPVQSFSIYNLSKVRDNSITCFFQDHSGNMWIGSSAGVFEKPLHGDTRLISNDIKFVNTIGEDIRHTIWIGTEKDGLFKLNQFSDPKNQAYKFERVKLTVRKYQSFSVQSICCLKNGDVYIGTKEGCLYLYDQRTDMATDQSGKYGISDEGILNILEDNYGYIWLSTIKKIIRYNPFTHASAYYSSADGILINSFFKDAGIKLSSGHILFGGNNGICVFDPANQLVRSISRNQHVAITDVLIQNKSIYDDDVNTHFNVIKKQLTLKYAENNLSIEFSALDFSSTSKSQYAFKLSGLDNEWSYVNNNRRFVNYPNLPVGKYTFMVKASDENGLWSNQVTTLKIVILPPFYRTVWAYLVYLMISIVIAYFISRTVVRRVQLRNELKISRIEKEKSEELAQIKLRYFTNISHELLTPLTIIMLQIEKLQKIKGADVSQFEIMKDNVLRLKRLIKQILVFRKTESGNMKLKISKNDIIAYINNICYSNFKPMILEKEIDFHIDVKENSYMAYFDPDKLDKIIYNLLSNAFKHTPKRGNIAVKISFVDRDDMTIMRLSVADTGDGISEGDLPHIFERFYISSTSDHSQSHGIGLSLTSDLLKIHKGRIEVKSNLGEGSVFTIEIPVSIESYTADELSSDDEPDENSLNALPEINNDKPLELTDEQIKTIDNFTILVVEDNKELNKLIVENFSDQYQVLSAGNGVEAMKIIQNNEIDLIISDVMMPDMDGLTFCRIIKNDLSYSHIHVLMLTARNSTEDRIECYNAGADSYISKPFEIAVLNARVRNLLAKRMLKTEHFKKEYEINISHMEYNSIDENFLQQAILKVEEKLADDSFDFDQFAILMASSKSTLHRKLKSLTGLSPGEFIRNVRLKHAAQMLNNNIGNISEIAFAVGFNDPKYFSRCFKNEFGMTPKEFQEIRKI